MKKHPWYTRNPVIILLLIIFFPAGLFLMWKYTKWNKKVKWAITGFFAFILFIGAITPDSKEIKQQSGVASTPAPVVSEEKQEQKPVRALEKIENTLSKYDAEVTMWSGDDFATEDNAPYNLVVNFPFNNIYECDNAKRMSFDIFKALYEDNDIRPKLSRVLITVPYSLRVSLGASDGTPMGEKKTFGGPTNFWKVMENFLGEDETGDLGNRTWASYLTKCE